MSVGMLRLLALGMISEHVSRGKMKMLANADTRHILALTEQKYLFTLLAHPCKIVF